jgi:hypothetical protein
MRWARLLSGNPISLAGTALALVGLANLVIFFLIDLIADKPNPYIGILAYMISPGFLVLGLLIYGVGIWRSHRKQSEARPSEYPLYPRIDLNDGRTRSAVLSFSAFLLVFILLSSMGSYKAYEYTDSVQFCGQVCHNVMRPEFTAYQLSPHARVGCVECHVGSGATWYVKSKLSGARQVFAAIFNTFPRPIPTPVHNLRPAQETCEQCHWPRKFYGAQLRVFNHFASDEKNTLRQIRMLINTGGGDPATGAPEGIHWHMNIGNEITFVAADEKRQTIPYIHVKDLQGRVTEYYAKDSTLTKDQIASSPKHRMDCVDCHNRPTHVYLPPDRAVDESLLARRIDASLPYVKQQAVTALSAGYNTEDAAMQGIAGSMQGFYESKYPDIARSKQLELRNAIQEVQQLYRHTTFPEMKVNWQTHPNNLGHFYFSGCFRCHDGQHATAEGKVISKECNACHTVLSQHEGTPSIRGAAELSFQHPVDLGDISQVNCSDCHTGGAGP